MSEPTDMQIAHEHFGAACGHGALAAALGIPVVIVCFELLPDRKSWVNMPDMEAALNKGKIKFTVIGRKWPTRGLALIQWEGPWTQPNVPARVACTKRHWVAVNGSEVWDANLEHWVSRAYWETFASDLMPDKATGWSVARGYELAVLKAEGRLNEC